VAAGGRCEGIDVLANHEMSKLALQAASALNIDYCGVDIIQSVTGEYYVLEVNSVPAWKGLQSVADVDIAELLVNDFLNKLKV
jgi:glutathione synthase/RimK-type ligase-like ATP-grasp enzyme